MDAGGLSSLAILVGAAVFVIYPWLALGGIWRENKRQSELLQMHGTMFRHMSDQLVTMGTQLNAVIQTQDRQHRPPSPTR